MAKSKVSLQKTSAWDAVLYPVEIVPITKLLPHYKNNASDRQNAIIGNNDTIYGIQGNSYTVIPNRLIYDTVNAVIGEHEVSINHNVRGEFSINVYLPSTSFYVGEHKDELFKSIIFGNSYNGRAPFTVQGSVVHTVTDRVRERGMKISYYRKIWPLLNKRG